MSFLTGIEAEANISLGITVGAQSFYTIPVVNTRTALYTLSIRAAQAPFAAAYSYTFPLSPSALSKRVNVMTNVFDVAGTPAQGGVQRLVDNYGNAPPMWAIEGTTGWKRHSTDGYSLDGIDSIIALQQFLQLYAQLNALQDQNDQPPYILEFYDYFMGDFWQISPIGPQEIRQNRQRPLIADYVFRWAGIAEVGGSIQDVIDQVLSLFSTPAASAAMALETSIGNLLTNYEGQTPGGVADLLVGG